MRIAIVLAALLSAPVAGSAPPADSVRSELDDLRRRLEDLEAQSLAEDADPGERTYDLYGFFDMSFLALNLPEMRGTGLLVNRKPGFVFGHLNLYHDFRPSDAWRMLAEVAFTLAPMGTVQQLRNDALGLEFRRANTTALDFGSFGTGFDWGGIAIERAFAEWTAWEPLSVRVGIFLTPFGIWNVDHGSPARTMVQPPLMYSSHFGGFPERQLGIELYGRARTGAVSWDYHLTVSNGGGPTQLYFDLDDNKAIGARLKVSQAGRVRWHFGISGLWSTTTDNEQHLELPDFDVTDEITVRHDDLVLGADASLKVDGFAVATEVVASWREYADGERPPTYVNPTVLEPDRWAVGVYAQLSYDLPIQGVRLRPYVMGSFIDWDDNRERDDTIGIAGGLRWGFTPTVALKIEYQHWRWVNEADDPVIFDGTPPWHIYTTELSVAF